MASSAPPQDGYVSYSHATHSDVLLPTMDHAAFLKDHKQRHALLCLLYDKVCVEHRKSNADLFLAFDHDRSGSLSAVQFQDGLREMGAPLTLEQVGWLMETFDADSNGRIDYAEFIRMLTAWRAGDGVMFTGAPSKTGLDWPEEPFASPFKAADEAREARKKVVLEQYAAVLKRAHEQHQRQAATREAGTQTEEAQAQALSPAVAQTLRKLARVAYGKLGGLRRAFKHMDGDGDATISKADLSHTLEHHLGLALPAEELEALFHALDFDGQGAVHYYEFIQVMGRYAEDTEGGDRFQDRWSFSPTKAAAAMATADAAAAAADNQGKVEATAMVEGDETAGFTEDAELAEDEAILRRASEALHERGLHAHALIKALLPDNTTNKVDAAGLKEVFARLGLPLTDARAARFMKRADLMGAGEIVSWELVRLISSAASKME